MPVSPSLTGTRGSRGHLPRAVPAAPRPGTPQDPGSPPNAARVSFCQIYRMEISRGFLGQPVWRQHPGAELGEGSPGRARAAGERAARRDAGVLGVLGGVPGPPGPWAGCGSGASPRCLAGAQRAGAGRYDCSICWLLVCFYLILFFNTVYIAGGGAGLIATLPDAAEFCSYSSRRFLKL